MAQKTKTDNQETDDNTQSLQATVVSVFTKIIDADTKVTYALLRREKEHIYAAWQNSYFARDIMVHRKYTFSGRVKQGASVSYMSDPIFTDLPIVHKYFDFGLTPPSTASVARTIRTCLIAVLLLLIAFVITWRYL